jgi:AcrR family transcriptional regulator
LPEASAAHRRIVDAALELAMTGGMEAMQMRDVAAKANVSTRTLYLHFPTKNYLLLAALVERGEALDRLADHIPRTARDPVRRVVAAFDGPTRALMAVPNLAKALMSALVVPDPQVIPLLREYRDVMMGRVLRAITSDEPTAEQTEIAYLLTAIWFSAMVSWTTAMIEDADFVLEAVEAGARHMLR